jgi:hypothetical protein
MPIEPSTYSCFQKNIIKTTACVIAPADVMMAIDTSPVEYLPATNDPMASAALYTAITPPTQDTPKAGVIMSLVKSPQMKARCKPMYRKINISSSIFFSNRSENPLFTKERLQMTELTESLCSKGCSDVHIWSCGLKRQANTVPTAILPRNTMKSCTIPGVVMLGSTDELCFTSFV